MTALAAWQVLENWDKPYPEASTDSNPMSAEASGYFCNECRPHRTFLCGAADTLSNKTRWAACTLALPIVLSLWLQTHYLKTSRPLIGGIDKFAALVGQ